jgi:hypothetical protein
MSGIMANGMLVTSSGIPYTLRASLSTEADDESNGTAPSARVLPCQSVSTVLQHLATACVTTVPM